MYLFSQSIWQGVQDGRFAMLLLEATFKSLLLLATAGVVCYVWRKATAPIKYLIWFGAVLGSLFLPVISWLGPAWRMPLWTASTRSGNGNEISVAVGVSRDALPLDPVQPRAVLAAKNGELPSQAQRALGLQLMSARFNLGWIRALTALWVIGALFVLARIAVDQLRLRILARRALAVVGEPWESLLCDLCKELHLRRPVVLLQSENSVTPITWGWLRPCILLPVQAKEWSMDKRRAVFLHELAHVKRWDCFAQFVARVACAIYWFNPLLWIALRQMCAERERACDNLVLENGLKASDYAGYLVEIAASSIPMADLAGVTMARSSQLKSRIVSITSGPRSPRVGPAAITAIWLGLSAVVLAVGGNRTGSFSDKDSRPRFQNQLEQVRSFSISKFDQSQKLAAGADEQITPEFNRFFVAATNGDWQIVTNMYEDFKRRHPQYSHGTNESDEHLSTPYWSPVLEICLAYDHLVNCDPKYTALFVDEVLRSVPAGSIYFGGTDPGRGLPTAFSKSHENGNPFFTLTQNALADGSYLEYLRSMYGSSLYIPTEQDSQRCFQDYSTDAKKRLFHDRDFPTEPKQIRPGENVREVGGQVGVSGKVAVMSINAGLAKLIFDRNSDRNFFIEESFPLDWMFPYLEPHGLVMKINRTPLTELSEESLHHDREYWQEQVTQMIGAWLLDTTPVSAVAEFVQRVHVEQDLTGFRGDVGFIQNDYSKRFFSKLRSSIGDVYAWRVAHPTNPTELERMAIEADYAFRQAFALCPSSSEVLFRYTTFLVERNRVRDALILAKVAFELQPKNTEIQELITKLQDSSANH
jgi:beta-lactamase regulating signal transducer with metallopeptidase domain